MASSSGNQEIEEIVSLPHGTKLESRQSLGMASFLWSLISAASDRRNRTLLRDNDMRQIIGEFMQSFGMEVEYRVITAESSARGKAEHMVMASMEDWNGIVQVFEGATKDDLAEVNKSITTVRGNKMASKFYLGTDILNYGHLASGSAAYIAKDLMLEKGLGIIFADPDFMMICDNYSQLALEEKPEFLFSPPKEKKQQGE